MVAGPFLAGIIGISEMIGWFSHILLLKSTCWMLPRGLSLTPGCAGDTRASFRLESSQSPSAQGCGSKVSRKLRRVSVALGQTLQLPWSLALLWVLLLAIRSGNNWLNLGPSSYREDEPGAALPVPELKSFFVLHQEELCDRAELHTVVQHNPSCFYFPFLSQGCG